MMVWLKSLIFLFIGGVFGYMAIGEKYSFNICVNDSNDSHLTLIMGNAVYWCILKIL